MPGEFFDDRELERDLLDEFPTPLADVFDDLTYERAPRGRLAKVIDLFRVGVRLLAIYALAALAEEEPPPEALARLRKLLRQRISEGDWIGLARETVRPFARTPAPFPIPEIAAVFFRPGTEQPLDPGVVYALAPAGPLRLGPLVQFLVPPEETRDAGRGMRDEEQQPPHPSSLIPHPSPELFLLETGGRREARLQAFPSGRELASREAQAWLARRAEAPAEPEERGPRFDVPMIDRVSECEQFRRRLRPGVDDRQGQGLVIEGEAGGGKKKVVGVLRGGGAAPPGRGGDRGHPGPPRRGAG